MSVIQLDLQLIILLDDVRDLFGPGGSHIYPELEELIPQLIVLVHVLLEDLLDLEPLPLLVLHEELLAIELVLELSDLLLVHLPLLPLLKLRLEGQLLLEQKLCVQVVELLLLHRDAVSVDGALVSELGNQRMLHLGYGLALQEVTDNALVNLQGHLKILYLRNVLSPLRLQEGLLGPLERLHMERVRVLVAEEERGSYSALRG